MNILFLSKRRPQNRDLFSRPYGRFYHLPRLLAQSGADVHLVLGSYEKESEFVTQRDGMTIYSRKMFPNLPVFNSFVRRISRELKPDVCVGLSDTWLGIMAASAASAGDTRLVIDAYDNYEAYMPKAKPLHWLWHRALGKAEGLTAAGPQLLELLAQCNAKAQRCIVPMAADDLFKPLPMEIGRARLNLPTERKLVGYLGTADSTRGFDLFAKAMQLLHGRRQDFDLILSGRSSAETGLPAEHVHQLGYVADDLMPDVLNSCNILVCVNRDSAFGNYSYPVKIYEAQACARPVIASDTPPARWILGGDERFLARVGDPVDLAMKVARLLDAPPDVPEKKAGWESSANTFRLFLEGICS